MVLHIAALQILTAAEERERKLVALLDNPTVVFVEFVSRIIGTACP